MRLGRLLKTWSARVFPAALLILMTALTTGVAATVGVQAYSGAVHGTLHAAQDVTQSRQGIPAITSPDCPLCVASHTPAQTPQAPVGVTRLTAVTGHVVPVLPGRVTAPPVRSHAPRAPPVSLLSA